MPQAKTVARTFETQSPPTARGKLFKADRPRAIDRYINYFGGQPVARVSPGDDPRGERLLGALASEEKRNGERRPKPEGTTELRG